MKIDKKKLIYLGVGLVGAYFLFPQATQVVEYFKSKLKKPATEPEKENETKQPKKACTCITTPCNC